MKGLNLFPIAAAAWIMTFYFMIFGPTWALWITIPIVLIERLLVQISLIFVARAAAIIARQLQQGKVDAGHTK